MLSAIKLAFSAIKIAFSISERLLLENFTGVSRPLEVSFLLMLSCCASCPAYFPHNLFHSASPFPGVWKSFISVKVCIPAFAPSCQKRLTSFFVRLLFFLQLNTSILKLWRTWLTEKKIVVTSENKIVVGLYKQQSSRDLTFLCVAKICWNNSHNCWFDGSRII